jgi:phosphatidylserine/phosphatidylglycerophosphate/cardiolipin synthase-like enzyme
MTVTVLLLLSLAIPASAEPIHIQDAGGSVNFSPDGGCTAALAERIGQARKEILVECYSFTSRPIAQALIEAHQRGVTVLVISDPTNLNGRGSMTAELEAAGVTVLYDTAHKIAHNKVMTFDGVAVATGSFNFSASAEHANAENLLILENAGLASIYARRWHELREYAVPRVEVVPRKVHARDLAPEAGKP